MHEYHKAVEWVEKANAKAAEVGASKVTALKVTFGEASDYSPEVVKNYFDEAAAGTACEAPVLISQFPVVCSSVRIAENYLRKNYWITNVRIV